jgi:hypothetical protein
MTGSCGLCGAILTAKLDPALIVIGAGRPQGNGVPISDEEITRERELQEFDSLAQNMLKHMSESHPAHAQELVYVANLCTKVYAVRNLRSSERNYFVLRSVWRDTIRNAIFEPIQDHEATADGGASSSAETPSGS